MSGEMRDEGLEAAVHEAFTQQARSAPHSAGLLAAVKERSGRRRRRGRAVGAGLATALAVAGVILGTQLPRGGVAGPDTQDPATGERAPGVFAADEINLCLVYDGGRLVEVGLAANVGDERLATAVDQPSAGQRFRVHVERTGTYTLGLDVLGVRPAPQALDRAHEVVVDQQDGRLGDEPASGERALYLDTGVRDSVVRLGVDGTGPGDTELLAWAEKFTVGTDLAVCDS